ncbi:MAG: Anthranilate phosphoribosyltransferase (EC [uncultured Sulfurovum sp.]|uniref:Anthranilate phosphoribosyltransferase n=1 Tax=uncultured Sulfurovum sp. TaxID=269237 RepID=A0A6S6RZJ3_9BACT|nr:MAG: Anthranilate phosphoribosyltransferase (EC [uncultured Sulfurovum sp.]
MTTREKFEKLFANELTTEDARAFLIELYEKGETAEEIAIAASVMREHSIKLPMTDELKEKAIDVVGTGGDKSGSFNISTTVALLLAAMGKTVAKHGNRSITSNSGSADLLEALNINLNLTPEQQVEMLEKTGFCFIFAVNHHPAMKHIMPIRHSIEHRTIFNLLGPLTNPAGAKKYLLGVFHPEFIERMANALLELDITRAFVVSSNDGMDEIALATTTPFAYVEDGKISTGLVKPTDFGFRMAGKGEIMGGTAEHNAMITREIFAGIEKDAKLDIVLLNTAFALFADGSVRDMKEALDMVKECINSGQATKHLEYISEVSNSFSK